MDFLVKEEDAGIRLDRFLADNNTKNYTRSFIIKMIEGGCVMHNGKLAKPSIKLKEVDYIALR